MKKFLAFVFIGLMGIWFWWHHGQFMINVDDGPNDVEIVEITREIVDVTGRVETAYESLTVSQTEPIERPHQQPAIPMGEHDPLGAYFYLQLAEEDREIYRLIRYGVLNSLPEITIETDDVDRIHDIFRRILFDHPELFWVTGAGSTTVTRTSDGHASATFKPDYAHKGIELLVMKAEIERAIDAFLATVEPNLTDYELVRVVYEYLIKNTTYNLDAPDNQNIYSVFVNGESVCAGISRAAQLLLNRLGIFATYVVGEAYVPGTSTTPIAHAWNLVRVGGEYYYLDVTWGLPTFGQDSELAERIHVIYDYLLLPGELIYRTHTLSDGLIMPEVSSWTHTFFYLNNMFYDSNDPDILLEALNTSVLNGEEKIAFQFATLELFEEMREIIIDELAPMAAKNLLEWHDLTSTQYFFRERASLNKMTIYWTY